MAGWRRHGSEDALDRTDQGNAPERGETEGKGQQLAGTAMISRMASVITWERPLLTAACFIIVNLGFWFVVLSSWRMYYLLALCLVTMVTVQMVKDVALSRKRGAQLWRRMTEGWGVALSGPGRENATDQVSELRTSCRLLLQEMATFKEQSPGKFCLLSCSLCTFCAVLGRCVPGVVISYILVLGVFLWPLLSWDSLFWWVRPALRRLDFGVGAFLQTMRENHAKRMLQNLTEHSEIDLSALCPQVDLSVCKDLSISDTEASDVTWTDGTFNLSEGHTPQTENSEDLDRRSDQEEVFTEGLAEFPSVDNGTNGEDDELSIGLPTPPPVLPGSRLPLLDNEGRTLDLMHQMAGDVIAAAVTATIREHLQACGQPGPTPLQACGQPGPTPLDFAEESDSEGEDFELLDQSELEVLESDQGQEAQAKARKPSGFLSKLLRRQ